MVNPERVLCPLCHGKDYYTFHYAEYSQATLRNCELCVKDRYVPKETAAAFVLLRQTLTIDETLRKLYFTPNLLTFKSRTRIGIYFGFVSWANEQA